MHTLAWSPFPPRTLPNAALELCMSEGHGSSGDGQWVRVFSSGELVGVVVERQPGGLVRVEILCGEWMVAPVESVDELELGEWDAQ